MSQLSAQEPITSATSVLPSRAARTRREQALARPGAALLVVYSATLFVSSSLLFLVQPMFAKMLLPRLGGTPAVWNTCMVFFQACLLAGYLYSHLTPRWLGIRRQAIVHLALLSLPLLLLPLRLPTQWSPTGNPIFSLLAVLTISVGVPFFVVSTSGPLLQKWFAATGHRAAVDPYFLYAASNVGSLLALLGYPALVEPILRLAEQTHLWTYGYVLLMVLIMACAAMLWQHASSSSTQIVAPQSPLAISRRLQWIALAFVPSSYLLGVTTFMTTDIAAVPLFWVVPLAVYLLSFILVFLKKPVLSGELMARLLPVALIGITLFMLVHAVQPIWLILLLHLGAFFLAAMVCHGELARLRPAAEHLTDFYLMMSLGGVLGGLFNALLAPTLFNRAYEYPIAIVLTCLTLRSKKVSGTFFVAGTFSAVLLARTRDVALPLAVGGIALLVPLLLSKWIAGAHGVSLALASGIPALACMSFRKRRWRFALGMTALLAIAIFHVPGGRKVLSVRRSFFGVHRIVQSDDGRFYELFHGTTIHGRQRLVDRAGRSVQPPPRPSPGVPGEGEFGLGREPLTYYHRTGPAGDIFSRLPHDRVAAIGLGVGSLAAYADARTRMTFYEIDREVQWAAEESGYFNFLASARNRGAAIDIILGDARLTLRNASNAAHDLLVLDAFSGDAVPAHLLTREAMAIYLRKLTPSGVLAAHISNVYLDLKPVLAALAKDAGCACLCRDDVDVSPQEMADGKTPSQWIVIARYPASLRPLAETGTWHTYDAGQMAPWTDDFSNILSVMRWRR